MENPALLKVQFVCKRDLCLRLSCSDAYHDYKTINLYMLLGMLWSKCNVLIRTACWKAVM